jgi:uncharacterized protein (DUF58 family)
MGYGSHHGMTKFEYGACLAASLGYLMNRQRDAVGLTAFAENIVEMLPASSRPGHLRALLGHARPPGDRPENRRLQAASPAGRFDHQTRSRSSSSRICSTTPTK